MGSDPPEPPDFRTVVDLKGPRAMGRPRPVAVPQPLPVAELRIRHYEIIRELGRGGMGQVLLARDTKLGRRVAVKFLAHPTQESVERSLAEARATASCV